jgi:hypothetical protein
MERLSDAAHPSADGTNTLRQGSPVKNRRLVYVFMTALPILGQERLLIF